MPKMKPLYWYLKVHSEIYLTIELMWVVTCISCVDNGLSLLHWNWELTCVVFWICQEKSSKTFKSVNATASSNSSSVGDVSDHDVNISIDHEDAPNAHDTNQSSSTLGSKSGISSSRDPYFDKIIEK